MNVGDFDGDGNEDIFLSQNFFALSTGMHSGVMMLDTGWMPGGDYGCEGLVAANWRRFRGRNRGF